jgi:nucleotide-binding universal stress UspA family protein
VTKILCPTRGGESSYPNQDRAIALANEQGAELLFLHVTDVDFLNHVASAVLVDVEHELEELGTFLLAMAQDRALAAGINAEIVVRHGNFRQAVRQVIEEYGATTLILGTPTGDTGTLMPPVRTDFIDWIVAETGVEVICVDAGEIVNRSAPACSVEEPV